MRWRGATALLLGLTLTGDASAGVQRFAIVAGANSGAQDDVELLYAVKDAERVALVLEELGGVEPADLILLRQASAPKMRSVFANLGERIQQAHERGDETMVYVYYSGHADGDSLRMDGTFLPLPELMDLLQGLPDVKVRVLLLDACQSGAIMRSRGAQPVAPFEIRPEGRMSTEGVAIITSSAATEDAQESDRLGGGVFTHHLVAGLAGAADSSGNGEVTITEAFEYAHGQTVRTTSRARVVQHPLFVRDLKGHEDLVLTTLADPSHSGVLALDAPGDYLVFEDRRDRALVMEFAVDGSARVSLNPGDYVVRRRERDNVREARISVARGDTTQLVEHDMATLPYGETVRKGLAQDKRLALAVTLGAGVIGSITANTQPAPLGALGLRLDLRPLTVGTRFHYASVASENPFLRQLQHRMGADLYAGKYFDLGRFSPGFGVRTGIDVVHQTFETPGSAPNRLGTQGRVGPMVALDVSIAPRWTIGLTGGVDVLLYSRESYGSPTAAFTTRALPHASLELSAYVF